MLYSNGLTVVIQVLCISTFHSNAMSTPRGVTFVGRVAQGNYCINTIYETQYNIGVNMKLPSVE